MFRTSHCLFIFFNCLTLMSGCVSLGSSLYFQTHGISECQKMVQNPLMVMGVILVLISVLGLIGIFCKITWLLWFYSCLTLLALIALTFFTVFVYVISNGGTSESAGGLGFKEYGNYSQWLKNTVKNDKTWNTIKSCLIDQKVCNNLHKRKIVNYDSSNFSPIEAGCCMPPMQCRYSYKNATYWILPKSSPKMENRDCFSWSNDQNKLCYDCLSCKTGVIDMTRMTWRIFAILDFMDIAIIIIVFTLSCCARRNIVSDRKYSRGYNYRFYRGRPV